MPGAGGDIGSRRGREEVVTQAEIETVLAQLDNLDAALLERISLLSDDELLAEMIEDGLDPEKDAEECRQLLQQAATKARIP